MALPAFQFPPCDPNADADTLRAAMKGAGTDEKTLIRIICNRSREQLAQIAAAFSARHHGHQLRADIRSEVSGNFKELLDRRFDPPHVNKARALHDAMAGAGTNDHRLIDCFAYAPNAEIPLIRAAYQQLSGKDLIQKVRDETSFNFKEALVDLLGGNRDEGPLNPAQVAQDVQNLYKAGEGKVGTDEKVFIRTLCNHAPWHNVAVNQQYGATHKHDLYKAIDKEFSGSIKVLLQALVTGPYEYWADRLYHSMKGAGTDDKTLTFILTLLDRHELMQVAALMKARHGADLRSMLKGDLSGDYLQAAMALCGVQ
jgi:hypothetical protein